MLSQDFQSLKSALNAEHTKVAREEMLKMLLEFGVSYNDFCIAYTYWPEKQTWIATLRTTREPLPAQIYDPVILAFNETFPSSYRNILRTSAEVRMAHETASADLFNSWPVVTDRVLAFKCEEMFEQIKFLKLEIKGWQRRTGDESTFLCWPGVWTATGRPCILISMHNCDDFNFESSAFDNARAFVRSLPEYRGSSISISQ